MDGCMTYRQKELSPKPPSQTKLPGSTSVSWERGGPSSVEDGENECR